MLDVLRTRVRPIGYTEEARELIPEALAIARAYPYAATWAIALAICFSRLGADFEQEMRDSWESAPTGPWKELVLVCLDRDFTRAAEIWAEAGSRTWEALLRLRAAEELIEGGHRAEGEDQLEKALVLLPLRRRDLLPRAGRSPSRGEERLMADAAARAEGRHGRLLRPRRLHVTRRGSGPRGRRGDPPALPRARARGARALRRHCREVHRRRRDGALRRAGDPRGRPRARGTGGARHPRLRDR